MPEVLVTYSPIYDKNICQLVGEERLASDEIESKKKRLLDKWSKYETEIFATLADITGLKWSEERIKCYLISRHYSFSDPLTLTLSNRETDDLIVALTHELIHRLFVNQDSNQDRCQPAWDWASQKFDESFTVWVHIVLYAILIRALKQVFERGLVNKERLVPPVDDYRTAWSLVQSKGPDKVLREFRSRIRSED